METYKDYLRPPTDPRIAGIEDCDAYTWADRCMESPRAGPMFAEWRRRLMEQPFEGVSTGGTIEEGLFAPRDDGAPVDAMRDGVDALLALLDDDDKAAVLHPLQHPSRRAWMNPEVYMNRFGLRLDEIAPAKREAILGVLRASMSERGFQKARNLMRINDFLGQLVNAPRVMNEYSYNFNLFGDPHGQEAWGWNFYGHHLCLNCTVVGRQMVFTPLFMGAEPNAIDEGPHSGTCELRAEETVALALMRSLAPSLQQRVRLYERKRDPAMPASRVAIGDELLLGGAFQDNRVVPCEGVSAREFTPASRDLLMRLVEVYHEYLPAGPLQARMAEVSAHLDDTHFCWIGGTGDDDPFYYRVQSPVLFLEFDHHAGVFLSNTEPKKFHIHTINRTPNGNDYGMALIKLCCEGGAGLFTRLAKPGQEGAAAPGSTS